MKKLIFIRHGKAEEPASEISDFERSLTLRGKTIARLMARKLIEKEPLPGLFITSPAFRGYETAAIFAGEYGINTENIILNSSLYYKMSFKYFPPLLSEISDETDILMLFGHNPSFTEISNMLSKEGCDLLPKTGIVCISLGIKKWSAIKQNSGKVEYFLKPEKLL